MPVEVESEIAESASGSGETPAIESKGPVGNGDYEVQEGDCMASIAYNAGFFWQTLWDRSENAELKRARGDPNVLLPGDRVFIPERRLGESPCATERTHTFVLKGVPAHFSLTLLDMGIPRANQEFVLLMDGKTVKGETDEDGRLSLPIPPGIRRGRLLIGPDRDEIDVEFGQIDPISEIRGIQSRLKNLGFYQEAVNDRMTPETVTAIAEFQRSAGLTGEGRWNDATRNALLEAHGS